MKKRRPISGAGAGGKTPGNLRILNLKKLSQEYDAAFLRRDMAECDSILTRILKAQPEHIDARLQRARLMGAMCRFAECRNQFDKVVSLVPADKRALIMIKAALLARDLYDPDIALQLFRRALAAGCPVEGRLFYAEHLMRMRRQSEALEQVETVLRQDPHHAHAMLLQTRLGGGGAEENQTVLRQLLDDERKDPTLPLKAGYDLAKSLDAIGDYEGAMEVLVRTKEKLQVQASQLLPGRRLSRKGLAVMFEKLDAKMVQSWKSQRYKPLNGLERLGLIVGHPRSGTTLLEQIVDSHPQTQSAEEMENFMIMALIPSLGKQTNMLDGGMMEALEGLQPFQIETARKAYRDSIARAMPIAPQTTLLVDKNPSLSNMICPFVRLFPEARIITMIRDPRDVVLSCYFQALLPLNPVSAAYTDLEETALDYAAFMEAYARSAEVLGDSVMELRYEDLVDDVESAARQVTSFLGQPWDSSVLDFHHRAKEKIVRSPTADAVTENVHRRAKARWKHYSRHLEPCMPHLEPFLERWGYA